MILRNTISQSVKFGLHFIGIWPGTPFPSLHKIGWIIVMSALQTYQYKYIIEHYKSDSLMITIDNLSIAMPFSLTSIKIIITWANYGALCEILSTMEEDCQKYAVIDINKLISKTGQLSFYLTSIVMSSYLASAVFYIIGTIGFQGNNASMPRELLLKMDLPFETSESPNYEFVVTTQFLIHLSAALAFGAFAALLLMLVLHVGCLIDIMCRNLVYVPYKNDKQIKVFINRHQEIIGFTERVEKLFTYIALSQLVFNTIITCCVGFLVVIAINMDDGLPVLIKSVVFYLVICTEQFVYCFAGEYLSIKSQLIGNTAYDFLWYDLRANESQLLIPLILRSQRGFTFTFGKFSSLSLERFTAIMKVSASYISVLLAVY
ncbi:Odorant receptor 13a [Anthophora retusa]